MKVRTSLRPPSCKSALLMSAYHTCYADIDASTTVHRYATIGGGTRNGVEDGVGSTIAGGGYNFAGAERATISGGWRNTIAAAGTSATISGGEDHVAQGAWSVVAGGIGNNATGEGAAALGGGNHTVSGDYGVVSGGLANGVQGSHAAIGGGRFNTASSSFAVIGGGQVNSALGPYTMIGGGWSNTARGDYSTVVGGLWNVANGNYSVAAGGTGNIASGIGSFVGGGLGNTVSGDHSYGAGSYANVTHESAAVLAFITQQTSSSDSRWCNSVGESTVHVCADNGLFVNSVAVATQDDVAAVATGVGNATSAIALLEAHIDALYGNHSFQDVQLDDLEALTTLLLHNDTWLQGQLHAIVENSVNTTNSLWQALLVNDSSLQGQVDSIHLILDAYADNHSYFDEAVDDLEINVKWIYANQSLHDNELGVLAVLTAGLLLNDTGLQQRLDTVASVSSNATDKLWRALVFNDSSLQGQIDAIHSILDVYSNNHTSFDEAVGDLELNVDWLFGNQSRQTEQIGVLEVLSAGLLVNDTDLQRQLDVLGAISSNATDSLWRALLVNGSSLQGQLDAVHLVLDAYASNHTSFEAALALLWSNIGTLEGNQSLHNSELTALDDLTKVLVRNNTLVQLQLSELSALSGNSTLALWAALASTNESLSDELAALRATTKSNITTLQTETSDLAATLSDVSNDVVNHSEAINLLQQEVVVLFGNHTGQQDLIKLLELATESHATWFLDVEDALSELRVNDSMLADDIHAVHDVLEAFGTKHDGYDQDFAELQRIAQANHTLQAHQIAQLDASTLTLLANSTALLVALELLRDSTVNSTNELWDALLVNDTALLQRLFVVNETLQRYEQQHTMFDDSIGNIRFDIDWLDGNQTVHAAQLDNLDTLSAELLANDTSLQNQLDSLSNSLLNSTDSLRDELAAVDANIASDLDDLRRLTTANVTTLQAESASLTSSLSEVADGVSNHSDAIELLQQEVIVLFGNHTGQQELIKLLELATDSHATWFLEVDDSLEELRVNDSALADEIDAVQIVLQAYGAQHDGYDRDLDDLQRHIEALYGNHSLQAAQLSDLATLTLFLLNNDTALQDQLDGLATVTADSTNSLWEALRFNDSALQDKIDVLEDRHTFYDASTVQLSYDIRLLWGNHSVQAGEIDALQAFAKELVLNDTALQQQLDSFAASQDTEALWMALLTNDTALAREIADLRTTATANATLLQDITSDLGESLDTVTAEVVNHSSAIELLQQEVVVLFGNHTGQQELIKLLDLTATSHAAWFLDIEDLVAELAVNDSSLAADVDLLSQVLTVYASQHDGYDADLRELRRDIVLLFSNNTQRADDIVVLQTTAQELTANTTALQRTTQAAATVLYDDHEPRLVDLEFAAAQVPANITSLESRVDALLDTQDALNDNINLQSADLATETAWRIGNDSAVYAAWERNASSQQAELLELALTDGVHDAWLADLDARLANATANAPSVTTGCSCEAELNATNEVIAQQDVYITELQDEVSRLNSTVTSLVDAVTTLLQASTFAPTTNEAVTTMAAIMTTNIVDVPATVTDCVDDGEDCGHGVSTEASTTEFPATTGSGEIPREARTVAISISLCHQFPCGGSTDNPAPDAGFLAFNEVVVASASIKNSTLAAAAVAYEWSLVSTATGLISWNESSADRFGEFTGSAVPGALYDTYDLLLNVIFADDESLGVESASTAVYNVSFATPPVLHSIQLQQTDVDGDNGSVALHDFRVAVNASSRDVDSIEDAANGTSSSGLDYEYRLVQYPAQMWQYVVAGGSDAAGATLYFSAPSTRSFYLHVRVTNVFGSSTSCWLPGNIDIDNIGGNTSSSFSTNTSSDSPAAWTVPCPHMEVPASDLDVADVVSELQQLLDFNSSATLSNATVIASVFLAGLDAVAASNASTNFSSGFSQLFEQFELFLDVSSSSSTDVEVLVLEQFVNLATDGASSSVELEQLLDAVDAVGSGLADADADQSTLDAFLGVVQTYADADTSVGAVSALEDVVDSVCVSATAGDAPDGEVETFVEDTFTVECASVESTSSTGSDGGYDNDDVNSGGSGDDDDSDDTETTSVVATTDTVTVVATTEVSNANDDISSAVITVTTWEANNTNETTFLSAVQGVTITSRGGGFNSSALSLSSQTQNVNAGVQLFIQMKTTDTGSALRKSVTCSYFDDDLQDWSSRGVVLRGLRVDVATDAEMFSTSPPTVLIVSVVCASSHLTVFTLEDDSEVARIVENKIQDFQGRFDTLGAVDLFDGDATLNPLFPTIFSVMTVGLIVIAVVSSLRTRRKAALRGARKVFVQLGALSKPSVVGGNEYEAILRGWLTAREVVVLVLLDTLSSNAFVSLFFAWSHEAVVFTKAHQAFILYSAVMSTFLVQAFFFDTDPTNDVELSSFWGDVADLVISSFFAKVFVFPVEYFLPYMIANVNSFSTSTSMPKSIVRRQIERLRFRICGDGGRSRVQSSLNITDNHTATMGLVAMLSATNIPINVDGVTSATARKERLLSTLKGRRATVHSEVTALKRVESDLGSSDEDSDNVARGPPSKHNSGGKQKNFKVADMNAESAITTAAKVDQSLKFLKWPLSLPSAKQKREQLDPVVMASLSDLSRKATTMSLATAARRQQTVETVLMRLQRHVRAGLKERDRIRRTEFDHWYVECAPRRHALSAINYLFLGVLAAFTFAVCLLVSAAFTDTECALWVWSVVESIAMQIFVTDIIIAICVLGVKLFVSWLLLRSDHRRKAKRRTEKLIEKQNTLENRQRDVESELRDLEASLHVLRRREAMQSGTAASPTADAAAQAARVEAKTNSLARGDTAAAAAGVITQADQMQQQQLTEELRAKEAAKQRLQQRLARISEAKARVRKQQVLLLEQQKREKEQQGKSRSLADKEAAEFQRRKLRDQQTLRDRKHRALERQTTMESHHSQQAALASIDEVEDDMELIAPRARAPRHWAQTRADMTAADSSGAGVQAKVSIAEIDEETADPQKTRKRRSSRRMRGPASATRAAVSEDREETDGTPGSSKSPHHAAPRHKRDADGNVVVDEAKAKTRLSLKTVSRAAVVPTTDKSRAARAARGGRPFAPQKVRRAMRVENGQRMATSSSPSPQNPDDARKVRAGPGPRRHHAHELKQKQKLQQHLSMEREQEAVQEKLDHHNIDDQPKDLTKELAAHRLLRQKRKGGKRSRKRRGRSTRRKSSRAEGKISAASATVAATPTTGTIDADEDIGDMRDGDELRKKMEDSREARRQARIRRAAERHPTFEVKLTDPDDNGVRAIATLKGRFKVDGVLQDEPSELQVRARHGRQQLRNAAAAVRGLREGAARALEAAVEGAHQAATEGPASGAELRDAVFS